MPNGETARATASIAWYLGRSRATAPALDAAPALLASGRLLTLSRRSTPRSTSYSSSTRFIYPSESILPSRYRGFPSVVASPGGELAEW